jgi:AcrR family transcriptional regulator
VEEHVKARRRYDATRRRERAARDRERVLDVAGSQFLDQGYATTTVAEVARRADVSPEYVYKTFGGKSGLVRAIYDRSLLGSGPHPAEQRSDQAQATAPDGRSAARQLGELAAEVAPLVAPILLLIRTAAAGGDPAMAELRDKAEAERLERMRHNATALAARGLLATDVGHAADVMWLSTSPELYESLVLKRGWSADEFGDFVGRMLAAVVME